MALPRLSSHMNLPIEFSFNSDPLLVQDIDFPLLPPEDIVELHYVLASRAVALNPFLQDVLSQIPLRNDYKNVYVDLRVRDLKVGQWPSLDKWHMDLVTHPLDPSRPETHHILVKGCKAPTLFLKGLVSLPIPEYGIDALGGLDGLIRRMEVPYFEAEEGRLTTFNRYHLHKGQPAKIDGLRYLLRVTETDLVRKAKIG